MQIEDKPIALTATEIRALERECWKEAAMNWDQQMTELCEAFLRALSRGPDNAD